jgi:hypothetical protein
LLALFVRAPTQKTTELALGCIRTFYALSASNKTSPLANIGFLAHRVTTSKTLAQTNKQALM